MSLFKTTFYLLCGTALFPALCLSQAFTIKQIAEPEALNRNPTVGSTGLVVWQETNPSLVDGANSAIIVYENGNRKNISQGMSYSHSANVFPKLKKDVLIWQSTFPQTPHKDASWKLKEVALTTNDIPELWASYEPKFSGGSPPTTIYTNAAGEIKTNAPLASGVSKDWNTFPGLQGWQPASEDQGTVQDDGSVANANLDDPNQPRRLPTGNNEIVTWSPADGLKRITQDMRNDFSPSVDGKLMAWQKAKGWPFGWEIMVYDHENRLQLTTNYYYDMAPRVGGSHVVWYGWDGNDYEIYLYDHEKSETTQLTDNNFDDVSPMVENGIVVWEAYPAVEADIYMWKEGQEILKLSNNIEDDINPKLSNGKVVWQGFDGDDFEIYLYDGEKTIKLTGNDYDDLSPVIDGDLIVWMGYEDNWDSEIFFWNGSDNVMLTTNEYEDRFPDTAGGRIVWQGDELDKSYIFLAEPQ